MTPVLTAVRCGIAVSLFLAATTASAQLQISRPVTRNVYTAADEVRLGREAAKAVLSRLQPLKDAEVERYVTSIGLRLTDVIPAKFRHASFQYRFTVLHVRDVTSFAFPGGQVFISARMIELADTEDVLAGLLAHELAHIVLRHATLQLTAGERFQIGEITGRQLGLAVAAPLPGILERGATYSIESYFLRFATEYEAEADELGARLAAAAGYDPAGIHDMFRELKTVGAAEGGLEWLGRHPNQRDDDIDGSKTGPSKRFWTIQERVGAIPRPRQSVANMHTADSAVGTTGAHVPAPEGTYRSVVAGDQLQLAVPTNWSRLLAGNTLVLAPEGAYVAMHQGPAGITHGIQVGLARSITGDVNSDLPALLSRLARANPRLTWTPAFQRIGIAGRDGYRTTMSHVSPVTGDFETVTVAAVDLPDEGGFLYFLGVAPQMESATYRGIFEQMIESARLNE